MSSPRPHDQNQIRRTVAVDNAKITEKHHNNQKFKHYLPIEIKGHRCRAVVDSGNRWRNIMSEDFATRIGIRTSDLRPLQQNTKVTSVRAGADLHVLGETREPLTMKLKHTGKTYTTRLVVIGGMHSAFNLSGPWLKTMGWDDLHSQGCLMIDRQPVPLVHHAAAAPQVSEVYVISKVTISPRTGQTVEVVIPDIRGRQTIPGTGCTELNERVKKAGLHTGPHVYHQADQGGLTTVPVLNLTDRAVTLRPDLGLGTFKHAGVEEVRAKWDKGRGPTTTKQKEEEYLRQLVNNAKEAKKKRNERGFDATKATAAEKEAWLIRTFELRSKPCLAKPRALKEAVDLLMKYWDLFSHDRSYGHTKLLQHRIITEDVPPIKCRYRPINPGLEPALREQLDDWLRHDVIEPADSPWSSNLVAVKKKGSKIRWCVDWRRLNEVTKKDSWPMPTVQDTIAHLAGSDVFSRVDCVEVHPEDREKTAFATPFGTFQQKRLGFGVTNGPATYCRLVDKVLKDIPPTEALSFVDDGVVHSAGLSQHLRNLDKTLNAYRKAGLKLAPQKCSFFSPQITYLGHIVDQHGVRPVDSYVKAVRDWALPKYKTEARAFLGIVGYYRQHIKDFAELARPWTDVTRKEADPEKEKGPLTVTPEMRKAFDSLKEALTTVPILGFPYFSGPKAGQFILDTDFCQTQTAGILSQLQKGKEIVIAYGSKKLNKSQRNYPSTKGELYAGIMWMDKYQYYLLHGPTFKWRTDNVALKDVRTMEPKGAIAERWLDMLATYDCEVEHRAGTKHTNTDALSRVGCPEPADPEGETAVMEVGRGVMKGVQARDLVLAQSRDPILKHLKEWETRKHQPMEVRELPGEGATYVGFLKDLEIGRNGVLMRKLPARALEPRPKVACVRESLKQDVIKAAHVAGGHMGIGTTVDRLKGRTYFPKMKAEVEDYIRSYPTCQRKTRKAGDQRHTLVSPTTGYPFQRLHVDLVGPLNVYPHLQGCLFKMAGSVRPQRHRCPDYRPDLREGDLCQIRIPGHHTLGPRAVVHGKTVQTTTTPARHQGHRHHRVQS